MLRSDAAPKEGGAEGALCPPGWAPLEWDGEILCDYGLSHAHTIWIAWSRD